MSARATWCLIGAVYVAATVALCPGTVLHPTTTLPSDLGDPILNTWILWWNAQATPLTSAWWDAPIFFPITGALALSETLLGLAILTTPLQWLGLSAVTTYNIAFLLSYAGSALAMHVLVWRLTGRHDAALVAGLVYGFNPYRLAHGAHIQMLSGYWMPLGLAGLHAYVERDSRRALALFAVSWLLQSLISGYFLFYYSVLVVLWIAWFARTPPRKAAAIVMAWVAAGVIALPVLLRYRSIQHTLNLRRGIGEMEVFSADVSALLAGSDRLLVWGGRLLDPLPEGELFLGFTALALVTIAAVRAARGRLGRLTFALLAAALVVGLLVFAVRSAGGLAIDVGPVHVTMQRVYKPFSVAVWLTALAAMTSVRFRDAFRARSTFAFYVVAAVVLVVLAFGPTPRIFGHRFWYQAPYRWLLSIVPGFDGVRVPARFGALAMLCVAAAAGLAYDRLRAFTWTGTRRTAVFALVIAGIGLDSAGRVPAVAVPEAAAWPELPAGGAVLELPLGEGELDRRAMFRSMSHRRPLVNGYSGYAPPHYEALTAALREGDRRAIDLLRTAGPLAVVVTARQDPGATFRRALIEQGARPVALEAGLSAFILDARPAFAPLGGASARQAPPPNANPGCGDAPLAIAMVRANAGTDPRHAYDDDVFTAWQSHAPQRGGEQLVIDLGSPRQLDAMTLRLGPFSYYFPRRLRIDVSQDAERWSEVWNDAAAFYAAEGGIEDPHTSPMRIRFRAPAAGRFIALTQRGEAPNAEWAIAEIEVCGR